MSVIGYTTGVFDMFHIGHLNILKRAKMECDYLIVGVTTDELCLSGKNKQTIIPFEERIQILEHIKFVDEVVPQTNYDKMEAFKRLNFDKMFVGNDWQGSEKWKKLEEEFDALGVEICYFPYTNTTSSSKLRRVIDSMLID
ncbi:adenylyltransferase/cytidyltransferase family protein [Moellerella wisconsensis]|uniref:adenylyltransferase/cytidyltransferase family protein n=1 Tax=Moellerella wisconsensis TaxID=158849 RepID=UPI0030762DF6